MFDGLHKRQRAVIVSAWVLVSNRKTLRLPQRGGGRTTTLTVRSLDALTYVFCNKKKTQTPTTGPAKDANTSIIKGFAAMTLTLHDISNRTLRLNWNALLTQFKLLS
jgi:hypothetical protein